VNAARGTTSGVHAVISMNTPSGRFGDTGRSCFEQALQAFTSVQAKRAKTETELSATQQYDRTVSPNCVASLSAKAAISPPTFKVLITVDLTSAILTIQVREIGTGIPNWCFKMMLSRSKPILDFCAEGWGVITSFSMDAGEWHTECSLACFVINISVPTDPRIGAARGGHLDSAGGPAVVVTLITRCA